MLTGDEIARHKSADSCWVVINGVAYDVTDFLPEHPGGAGIILRYAGRDATAEYEPVHPPGTIEENLPKEKCLGKVDMTTLKEAIVTTSNREVPKPPVNLVLNLEEFEGWAKKTLSAKAWAYYSSAADDLFSKQANARDWRRIVLRPRILVDVADADARTTFLGHNVSIPVMISPAAQARLGHPDGEAALTRVAGQKGIVYAMSNHASMSVGQVAAASTPDQCNWFQIYVKDDRQRSEALLAEVVKLGFKAVVLTVDAATPGKREEDERVNMQGMDPSALGVGKATAVGTAMDLTWAHTLPWLRKNVKGLPIIIKGIQTWEDAVLAVEHGVQGIIVSNHGGRSLDTAPSTVNILLEIRAYAPQVFTQVEVFVDGGIYRGTDVIKALCLGVRGVGIGRAPLYALGSYGPEGVARLLDILSDEIHTGLRLLGVTKLDQLSPAYLNTKLLNDDVLLDDFHKPAPRSHMKSRL